MEEPSVSQRMDTIVNHLAFGFVTYIIFKVYQKYTTGICTCDAQMQSRVVIITGGNTGLGYETAKDLARRGAKIILACRNLERGVNAKNKLYDTTGANIVLKHLDLSSFKSIQAFAKDIIATEPKIDVLINNAGTGKLDNSLTEDNLAIEAQVNHFGPFLLTMLLLPVLKASAPSRIINVASVMHRFGTFDPDRFGKPAKNTFDHMRVYSNTKLANILFSLKLSQLLEGTGVTVNSLHPGAVNTEIFRHKDIFTRFVVMLIFKTAWEGAQTAIHMAVSPDMKYVTGRYFVDCRDSRPSGNAENQALADSLWELSEKSVGLYN